MEGGKVVIWEVATGKESRRLRDNFRLAVACIAFSPDGKMLAAGAVDTLHLWNVADGKLIHQFDGHKMKIDEVASSPDGRTIESVAFSPDGKTLASASRDKTICLWDPATGRELRRLQGHTDSVLTVAFARDGKTLASGSEDNTIRLWELTDGKELRVLKGHSMAVSSVVFLADGKKLASSSGDKSIRLWDTATGKELRQMHGHRGGVSSIALSPDGKTLASGSGDRTVRLWDLAKGQELRPTQGHHYGLSSVAISPDGERIASGDESGEVRLWESATGKEVRLLRSTSPEHPFYLVDRLDFSPNGEILYEASFGFKLCRWETATGKPLGERLYKGVPLLTSDGKFVLSNNFAHGTIFLQETDTARTIREFKTQKLFVKMAVSPDGKFLAAGSPEQDGTVVLWELTTGKERCRCKGAYDQVGALAFSPDGKYLVGTTTRSRRYTPQRPVHLWDAVTGREVRQFRGHDDVYCLAFSSDGRTLASGGGQKTICLWETATGKKRRDLTGHRGYIRSLTFSPDGTRLASASYDTTALLWDVTGLEQSGRTPGGELSAKQLQALWTDLAGDDAAKAYRAIWLLARHPKQSVPLLREHVPPPHVLDAEMRKRVERWLAELDSDEATVRNRANAELAKRIVTVEAMMRNTLMRRPSLEQRKRIEQLLELLEPEQVTLGRALEVLEHAAAPESRQLLETLAAGEPEAWLTREAKAALQRVQARQDK